MVKRFTSLVKKPEQVDRLYLSIGRFVVRFEQLSHAMQSTVILLLRKLGLKSEEAAGALVAGLTADPLRRILEALVPLTIPDMDKKWQRTLSELFTRIQKINEKRNDIIHRNWLIDHIFPAKDIDAAELYGKKLHRSKAGAIENYLSYSARDIDTITKEAEELTSILLRIAGHIWMEQTNTVQFTTDKHGKLHLK